MSLEGNAFRFPTVSKLFEGPTRRLVSKSSWFGLSSLLLIIGMLSKIYSINSEPIREQDLAPTGAIEGTLVEVRKDRLCLVKEGSAEPHYFRVTPQTQYVRSSQEKLSPGAKARIQYRDMINTPEYFSGGAEVVTLLSQAPVAWHHPDVDADGYYNNPYSADKKSAVVERVMIGSFFSASVCLAIGVALSLMQRWAVSNPRRRTERFTHVHYRSEGVPMSPNVVVPPEWNPSTIASRLQQLRDQRPSLIPHFVESVKERFIIGQDDRTAQTRLQFLKSQIEQLQLAKQFKQLSDDLEILVYERQKRIKTLQLETDELDSKRQSRSELDKLATMKERRKIELEIAQLDREIASLKDLPDKKSTFSPEQERAKRHADSDARLVKLKKEKKKALRIEDEHERAHKVNAIDDEIQREMVEWSKTLP